MDKETAVSRPLRVDVAVRLVGGLMADPVHQIPQRAPEQAEAGTQISGARVSDDSCAGHRRTNLPRHLHQRPKRPRLDTHRPSSTLTQYATSGHLPQRSARLPLWDEVRQARSAVRSHPVRGEERKRDLRCRGRSESAGVVSDGTTCSRELEASPPAPHIRRRRPRLSFRAAVGVVMSPLAVTRGPKEW